MKVIFDIDGTLADNTHRMHLLPSKDAANKTEAWAKFNKACVDDKLIRPVYSLYLSIAPVYTTHLVTGRAMHSYDETCHWLWLNNIQAHDTLTMRPDSDHRKSADFKCDVFTELGLTAGDVVVEDDPSVIAMVKENFPGVIIVEVPSKCSAVNVGMSQSGIRGARADLLIADDLE